MTGYLRHALATSTRSSYSSAARSFQNFCITYNCLHPDGTLLPASEHTLMLFASFLARSLKPQSIKVYLYGVRTLHLDWGFPDPLEGAARLRLLLRGIKRVHGCRPDSRLPITPSLLQIFYSLLDLHHYDHLSLWAAFMVAFFGFLRSKELLNLRWQDLERHQEGFRISITASKTDPFRRGAVVEIKESGDRALCAVRALDCLRARAAGRTGLVFTFNSGQQIQPQRLNELIRLLASLSNVPVDRYSSHSFRIGAATTAAAAGVPDWCIQGLGRWSSDCYQRYIRLPSSGTGNMARLLAHSHL